MSSTASGISWDTARGRRLARASQACRPTPSATIKPARPNWCQKRRAAAGNPAVDPARHWASDASVSASGAGSQPSSADPRGSCRLAANQPAASIASTALTPTGSGTRAGLAASTVMLSTVVVPVTSTPSMDLLAGASRTTA